MQTDIEKLTSITAIAGAVLTEYGLDTEDDPIAALQARRAREVQQDLFELSVTAKLLEFCELVNTASRQQGAELTASLQWISASAKSLAAGKAAA